MDPFLPILLSLLWAANTAAFPYHQHIISTSPQLHPDQYKALQIMNIPVFSCSGTAAHCDSSTPFRKLISISLSNCLSPLSLSPTPIRSLSSLTTLELVNCTFNLQTNSTPLSLIVESLENLTILTISYSNLNECLPEKWNPLNLTHVNLSNNHLGGQIPSSLMGLISLKSLSLASNSLCGDVPRLARRMNNLAYLNLNNNNFNDDENCTADTGIIWSTYAVYDMSIVLSAWILVIVGVMLVANCSL